MLYKIAHLLRDKFPWLWDTMGFVLSWLFGIRYGKKLKQIPLLLEKYSKHNTFTIHVLREKDVPALAKMFREQPEEAFEYFKPHDFTEKTLTKLVRDKGFLAYIVRNGDAVVGYFFQRSFFWGKAFRGYITDYRWRRQGINKLMNECAMDISELLGLQVFGTIAPDNIASLKSAETANEVKIIKSLDNGDYFVQYQKKTTNFTECEDCV
ncbi:GNAT family N-acetyltransferase [Hoylesella buccalis]|uniref:GNAT family N-acetyltransferase n=1 Tax=Hoylesella buccalis TaxID=28127 RepID=UPI0026E95B68|nr:transcriptional regulator [Hoylesella buccalis]